MKIIFAALVSVAAWFPAVAASDSLAQDQLLQIRFDQKLDSQISLALVFRDETGKEVRLGDYFGKTPAILLLGYYGCPMLCTLTLNGATESFRQLKQNVGKQFSVIFVSIDPAETPALAAEKKRNYLRIYHRGDPNGWHFLTGERAAVETLAGEVGFRFAYDAAAKQFAHPSGLIVLTPDGKVSQYFFGVTFSAADLAAALRAANGKKTGSPVEQFVLLCFHDAPAAGKYGRIAINMVRAGCVATVLALAVFLILPHRRKSEDGR
jgi:protein SCO1